MTRAGARDVEVKLDPLPRLESSYYDNRAGMRTIVWEPSRSVLTLLELRPPKKKARTLVMPLVKVYVSTPSLSPNPEPWNDYRLLPIDELDSPFEVAIGKYARLTVRIAPGDLDGLLVAIDRALEQVQ